MLIRRNGREAKYRDPKGYRGKLEWDLERLADVLRLSKEEARDYFRDGRRSGFLVEKGILRKNPMLKAAPENMIYDVQNGEERWEVRTITSNGINFRPSVDIGAGRKFNKTRFEQKLQCVTGFIVCDVSTFPVVPYWSILSRIIAEWHHEKTISKGKTSYKKAIRLINGLDGQDQDSGQRQKDGS
ncbi:MAG: hypothetical protein MPJ06_03905 [Nitrosopumilus sp.]|nr:hypothetical protein [Nitrosopumilus sp.]